jgi:tetratricopeptide (TPR) repeat protein
VVVCYGFELAQGTDTAMIEAANNGWVELLVALAPSQLREAFVQYPSVVMGFLSMALSAMLIAAFWIIYGMMRASAAARIALRAQGLKRNKDHRALILIGQIDGANGAIRQQIKEAIQSHFGAFAFQGEVQIDLFPVRLGMVSPRAHPEKRRRLAVEAAEVLERTAADVIVWGRRNPWTGKLDLRMVDAPTYGRAPELTAMELAWKRPQDNDGAAQALTFACARRARPVLNRPQDYKPEKLQPIVESLDRLVTEQPQSISEGLLMEILSDFASGALSLGERGGQARWLEKALAARQSYLERVDRSQDPGAWGAAQQEIGRALLALGEREGARDKLEEAVSRLQLAMDALRATESLQHAEVANRALHRAQQTLQQRKRIGLRWPV